MPTVKGVLQKYHEGQNIFRREAVSCLVARIEQLEKYIASQQSVQSDGAILSPIERDWSGDVEDEAWAYLQKSPRR